MSGRSTVRSEGGMRRDGNRGGEADRTVGMQRNETERGGMRNAGREGGQAGGQEGGIRNAAERGDNGAMKPAGMNGRSGGAERGRGEGGRSEGGMPGGRN